ncbi:MAG: efflux RND transporter permease subunit [Candidatus Rokubacteria bacterium]|nr:efflux RND transporter permease subunit [Candidatus Rokubacteria bacterium]
MWLTLLAMRNAIAVLMAALAVVVLGATSISRLSIDLFPNINLPVITIGTVYTGANVQDIEKTVTYPIEKAVSAVANVHHVESKSRQGISSVQVWFNYDADINAGQNEVIQRIQQIMNTLPSGIKQPFIVRFDLSNIPVCLITLSGGGLGEKELYDIAFNTIEPQIERLPGVASANVDGGKIRQISVNLNRDLLYAKGISVLDVVRAVNDANFLLPSGEIRIGTVDYKLFTNNQFQLVKPMEDIVVRKVAEIPIHVRDLGYVTDSYERQTSIVRVNGERSVYLRVNKQPGANTVDVVDAVKAALPTLIGVPAGAQIGLTFDQSIYIRQSIESLWHEAGQGAALAFLVILIFLRSIVSTVIIFIAIPLSILCTFIAMYFLGQTINVFTLGGLALAVGRLVDDSIVELENINRHLALPGKDRRTAVLDAAREVAMPIFVSTITTIVVFLPTVFIEGQAKLLFLPLTFTISFSLFASFLVSRTATPLLCLGWLQPERPHDPAGRRWRHRFMARSRALFDRLDAAYQRMLGWALGHRKTVVLGILGVFLGSLGLYPLIGTEFFPASDESQFRVFVRAPIGTRIEETEKIVARIEALLRAHMRPGEYKTIVSSAGIPGGRSAIFTSNTGPHAAVVQVYLQTPDKRTRSDAELVNAIRPKFAGEFPGTVTFFNLGGIINRVLNRGSQNPLELELLGYDLADAQVGAREVARLMREVPNVADVQISREENYPQWSVDVDREKAAAAGLTQRDIAQAALFSLNSNVSVNPSIFTDPRTGNQYNIVVQLDEPFRVRPEDLGKIFVTAPAGRPVVLSTIAEIKRSVAPVEIERKYQQRLIRVSANPVGRDLGAISDDIEARLGSLRLPPGFAVRLGGQTAQQREAFSSLLFTTILALMLVYMVMASQFRSLKDPFIIMFSVPMGLIGVLWALFLTRTTLSTTSFMGIIMMVGIVVSNGVLLVEYTNELRRRGLALADAVLAAGRTRLRPILMTSLTTIVGLTPMAVGLLVGSEANAPLARAVIGGLLVSTGMTLLLIPTLYTILEERFPRSLATESAPAP